MQWYYLDANNEQAPLDEASLSQWAASGAFTGQHMVWREGLEQWIPAAQAFPAVFPAAAPVAAAPAASSGLRIPTVALAGGSTPSQSAPSGSSTQALDKKEMARMESGIVKQILSPIAEGKGWIKFVGVMLIIFGVLSLLPLGWLMIWMGITLFGVASDASSAYISGSRQLGYRMSSRLKTFFAISGIAMLLSLIITIGMIIFMIVNLAALAQSFGGQDERMPAPREIEGTATMTEPAEGTIVNDAGAPEADPDASEAPEPADGADAAAPAGDGEPPAPVSGDGADLKELKEGFVDPDAGN
jgi:hypothetical protein